MTDKLLLKPRLLLMLSISVTLVLSAVMFRSVGNAADDYYDVVVLNGRVMDPESNLDAVRNVGIRGGKV